MSNDTKKIKITTQELYDQALKLFGENPKQEIQETIAQYLELNEKDWEQFEKNTKNSGWFSPESKIVAMILNYNFGKRTNEWDFLPYASD